MEFAPVLVLCAIHGIAHFLLCGKMGVYEDDYYFIANAVNWDWHALFAHITETTRSWYQGRPLCFALTLLFPAIAYRLGGFHAIQIASLLLQLCNLILVYRLVLRISNPRIAFLSGLLFSLFSADTTRPMLHASFAIQTSLAFYLIASHLYINRRKCFSYIVASLCLISYESIFLNFFLLPAFEKLPRLRTWIIHLTYCLSVIGLALFLRKYFGEGRLAEIAHLSKRTFLKQEVLSWILGPWTTFRRLFQVSTPIQWVGLPLWQILAAVLCGIAVTVLLYFFSQQNLKNILPAWRLAFIGLAIWAISYSHAPLANSRFPPTMVLGRLTSIHTGGLIGGALFLAVLIEFGIEYFSGPIRQLFIPTLLGVFFSFTIAFHFHVQNEYALSWQDQRWFWKEFQHVVPDFEDGTVVFVEPQGMPVYDVSLNHSWSDLIILQQLYKLPDNWARPPRVFLVPQDWQHQFVHSSQNHLNWDVPAAFWNIHTEALPENHLIVLRRTGDHLERIENLPGGIQGHPFSLQSRSSSIQVFPQRPFFSILMGNELGNITP